MKKNLKWDVDNRICIQFPKEVDVGMCDFSKPVFKLDKNTGKIIIEIDYSEIEEDN
jgi:hypothetical protein